MITILSLIYLLIVILAYVGVIYIIFKVIKIIQSDIPDNEKVKQLEKLLLKKGAKK